MRAPTTCAPYLQAVAEITKGFGKAAKAWNIETFILQHGQDMGSARRLPPDVKRMEFGMCFMNASKMVIDHCKRFTYCEGYAIQRIGFPPLLHAWFVNRRGTVVDPTWGTGANYHGIAVNFVYMINSILAFESYGLLDRPFHQMPLLNDDPEKWHDPISHIIRKRMIAQVTE